MFVNWSPPGLQNLNPRWLCNGWWCGNDPTNGWTAGRNVNHGSWSSASDTGFQCFSSLCSSFSPRSKFASFEPEKREDHQVLVAFMAWSSLAQSAHAPGFVQWFRLSSLRNFCCLCDDVALRFGFSSRITFEIRCSAEHLECKCWICGICNNPCVLETITESMFWSHLHQSRLWHQVFGNFQSCRNVESIKRHVGAMGPQLER